jgi:hypothetical protein
MTTPTADTPGLVAQYLRRPGARGVHQALRGHAAHPAHALPEPGVGVRAVWEVVPEAGLLRCVETWHEASTPVARFEEATKGLRFTRAPGCRVASGRRGTRLDPRRAQDTNLPPVGLRRGGGPPRRPGFPILLGDRVLGVMSSSAGRSRSRTRRCSSSLGTVGSQDRAVHRAQARGGGARQPSSPCRWHAVHRRGGRLLQARQPLVGAHAGHSLRGDCCPAPTSSSSTRRTGRRRSGRRGPGRGAETWSPSRTGTRARTGPTAGSSGMPSSTWRAAGLRHRPRRHGCAVSARRGGGPPGPGGERPACALLVKELEVARRRARTPPA